MADTTQMPAAYTTQTLATSGAAELTPPTSPEGWAWTLVSVQRTADGTGTIIVAGWQAIGPTDPPE